VPGLTVRIVRASAGEGNHPPHDPADLRSGGAATARGWGNVGHQTGFNSPVLA
jgi:hypothetical protein